MEDEGFWLGYTTGLKLGRMAVRPVVPQSEPAAWRRWLYLYGRWVLVAALALALAAGVWFDGRGLGYW